MALLEELARGSQHRVLQLEAEADRLALEEQLAEATRTTELARERIMELTTTVFTLEATVCAKEQRLEDECARTRTLEASLHEGVDQLKRRYKSMAAECGQAKAHRDELSAKLVRTTEELAEAKSRHSSSEQHCAQQKRRGEDTESKLAELQDRSDQLRTDVEVWRARYEDGQTRHAKRLKTADSTQVDLITAQAELHYLRRAKEDHDKQVAQLHTENANLHRQNQTLSVYASFEQ
jgi:chromosome segregation ATPase